VAAIWNQATQSSYT